jgi:hypothetical protein
MGTTLTGTTPQDTYDSLIKVTDNGPISGTAKYLSDGLGNDSALALSTAAVGVSIASPATKLEVLDTFRVSTAGVKRYFDVSEGTVKLYGSAAAPSIKFADYNTGLDRVATIGFEDDYFGRGALAFTIKEQASGTGAEAMRITAAGNVGIGISAPAQKLHVAGIAANSYGLITTSSNWGLADTNRIKIGSTGDTFTLGCDLRANTNYDGTTVTSLGLWVTNAASTMVEVVRATANGLTFNGDTAAANALDDYEEGTFTPTITASGSNPTVTYSAGNTGGIYTKVGNLVTCSFETRWTALSGGSGNVSISGLPFTRRNTTQPDGERCIISSRLNTILGLHILGTVSSNLTIIELEVETSVTANTSLTVADLATTGTAFLRGTVSYFV